MQETVKTHFRRGLLLLTAAMIALTAAAFPAWALDNIPVLEQKTENHDVILYIGYDGPCSDAKAQVGTELASAKVDTEGNFPIVTWLLMDNSMSLSASDRERSKALVSALVQSKAEHERISLCTFSDRLEIVKEENDDKAELLAAVDGIRSASQDSFLVDALNEVLDREARREGSEFVRIIVISDGADKNPAGILREELTERLTASSIPIYTFGCKLPGNEAALQEMYSLSRKTGGESWSLTELSDPAGAARELSTDAIPKQVIIEVPDALRDGSVKGVRLTLDGSSVAEAQVKMPFGTASQTEAPVHEETSEEPETLVTEESPEKSGGSVLYIVIGAVVLVAVAICVFLFLRKSRGTKSEGNSGSANKSDAVRDIEESTLILDPNDEDDGDSTTVLLGHSERTLSLADLGHPEKYFEVPIQGKVSIGRDSSNRVVLNYDRSVSSKHCEVFEQYGQVMIRDVISSNGTLVNGTRVERPIELVNGCTLKLGRLEFRVGIR